MQETTRNSDKNRSDDNQAGGMENRGATRPTSGKDDYQKMDTEQRKKMLHRHHRQTLWIYWILIGLGIWMVSFPFTFSYSIGMVEPSGGRDVWLSSADRIAAMKWSDIISGFLLIFFGWRSLIPNRPHSLWTCCFIGIWISMAPLIFWAPTAAGYTNGMLVGALVIALTIIIPGMPNMVMYRKKGSEVPPGWSYNPSSWPQRSIMIVLAFAGWTVSRYLGAYQLGYIDHAWDPFFGDSTVKVLDSSLSHSWPVSDAALGTLAYMFEFLMAFMGGTSRWRTMPWLVTLFGIFVIPLGFVSIFLVISQPLSVGAWCTFCLATAAIMLPMIPLVIGEVIAMGQHLVQRNRRGDTLWEVFWKGGQPVEQNTDERSPQPADFPQKPRQVFMSSIWGVSFPRTLIMSAIFGIWLMFAPGIFGVGIETTAADINHLTGALIIVVAVVSMGEVIRSVRYLNVLLGIAVALLPWLTGDINMALNISSTLSGIIVTVLSIPQGKITEKYGLWGSYIK